MTRDKDPRNIVKATHTIYEDQRKWLSERSVTDSSDKSKLIRLALDVLRWMYERDGRLPSKEDLE